MASIIKAILKIILGAIIAYITFVFYALLLVWTLGGLYYFFTFTIEKGGIVFFGSTISFLYAIYYYRRNIFNFFKSIKNMSYSFYMRVFHFFNPLSLSKPSLHKYTESLPEIREEKKFDEEVLKRLLKHGADINATDNNGNTILHKTIKAGQTNATRHLMMHGAKLDIKNNFGKTPLEMATSKQMEKYLSIKNAILSGDAERAILLINAQKQISDSAMHYAAIRGNIEIASLLLEKEIDLESKDESGNTAIVLAVTYNQPKFLEWLIEQGANTDVKVENNKGLLHIAAMYGYDEIIKILVAAGLNVDDQDDDGHSSLWYAKKYGNYTMLKILKSHSKMLLIKKVLAWLIFFVVANAFLQYPNPIKDKVYQYSIDRGYFSIADFLAKEGADSNFDQNITKLIFSSQNTNRLKYILDKKNIDLNKQDSEGKTILHYAYEKAPYGIVKLLIDKGADENIEDNNGKKPCFYAVYNRSKDVEGCDTILKKDNR